jgi:hypothetical protein
MKYPGRAKEYHRHLTGTALRDDEVEAICYGCGFSDLRGLRAYIVADERRILCYRCSLPKEQRPPRRLQYSGIADRAIIYPRRFKKPTDYDHDGIRYPTLLWWVEGK